MHIVVCAYTGTLVCAFGSASLAVLLPVHVCCNHNHTWHSYSTLTDTFVQSDLSMRHHSPWNQWLCSRICSSSSCVMSCFICVPDTRYIFYIWRCLHGKHYTYASHCAPVFSIIHFLPKLLLEYSFGSLCVLLHCTCVFWQKCGWFFWKSMSYGPLTHWLQIEI